VTIHICQWVASQCQGVRKVSRVYRRLQPVDTVYGPRPKGWSMERHGTGAGMDFVFALPLRYFRWPAGRNLDDET
jgi:hypothetical protein